MCRSNLTLIAATRGMFATRSPALKRPAKVILPLCGGKNTASHFHRCRNKNNRDDYERPNQKAIDHYRPGACRAHSTLSNCLHARRNAVRRRHTVRQTRARDHDRRAEAEMAVAEPAQLRKAADGLQPAPVGVSDPRQEEH